LGKKCIEIDRKINIFPKVDQAQGTLCWRSFKRGSTPIKNDSTPQQEAKLKRKPSQGLSRFFFPFTTKDKTSGTSTPCDFYRTTSESSLCLQRSQSTLTCSTKIQSKPSFLGNLNKKINFIKLSNILLGIEPQYVFLSKLKKISYSWIYKPNKAVSLIRKHSRRNICFQYIDEQYFFFCFCNHVSSIITLYLSMFVKIMLSSNVIFNLPFGTVR
jgi:hypothetical protein